MKNPNLAAPKDLKRDISQLQGEKTQLREKIESLKRRTASINGFKAMMNITSTLRREQEEEGKIMDRLHEQRAALSTAETRLSQLKALAQELRTSSNSNNPLELVNRLENEVNVELLLKDVLIIYPFTKPTHQ